MTPVRPSNRRPRVLIAGGGLAGLAAAVALADDCQIVLVERRKALGGRASSFIDDETGEAVDNCQHVLMRCCTNLLDLYCRLGVDSQIRFYDSFQFLGPDGATARLGGSNLPAPLHLAPAFLGFGLLTLRERMLVANAVLKLIEPLNHPSASLRAGPATQPTFGAWLRAHGQPTRVIELFWSPIIVSALNEEVDRAALRYARQVFVEGFLATRHSFEMGLPRRPLHELYTPAIGYLTERGGEVRLGAPIDGFVVEADSASEPARAVGVRLSDGTVLEVDHVISAVPFEALLKLLPPDVIERHACFRNLRGLEHSPIIAVHLWFDRAVTEFDHVALPGRTIQWIFNKSKNYGGAAPSGEGDYLGLVVSAARTLMAKPRGEIIELALRDLCEAIPSAREARVTRAVVIREPRATFACTPASEALRPNSQTPIAGFYLAGDWTNTGWPATMEGAVISGYRCAELVLRRAGAVREIVCHGLPPEALMEWLQMRGG